MNADNTTSWRKWVFPVRPNLTDDLTTFDWLKTAAILLMIIDHVGYFIFPQIEWFRVFGRLCVPIFFFLIGYANTREINMRWLAGAGILLFASLMLGQPVLPLSILVTMLLIRLVLDPIMEFLGGSPVYIWWVLLLLVFAMLPSDMLVEYGTIGLAMAMCGFAVKHHERMVEVFGRGVPQIMMASVFTGFWVLTSFKFGFTPLAIMVLGAGLIGLYFVLQNFKGEVLEGSASHPHAALIRFCGRYTLEIYVIHLLILKMYLALETGARMMAGLIY